MHRQKSPFAGLLVLYLDFDGVLHHYDVFLDGRNRPVLRGMGELFEYADRLDRLLAPYPEVRIVLATSWVRTKGFEYALRRLSESLQCRVIGATWHSRFAKDADQLFWWSQCSTRYEQIMRDVVRRNPQMWLALDDDAEGWVEGAKEHLVLCDSLRGLGDDAVCQHLSSKLSELHAALAAG